MNSAELLHAYALAHDLERGTTVWLGCAIGRWAKHLGGRSPEPSDFDDAPFNSWLTAELAAAGISRQTIRSYRRAVLMLWRWGFAEGYLPNGPRSVKRIKAPLPIPSALSAADVDQLLSAAAKVPGSFRRWKVTRTAFYRALILLAWDSGLRLADMLRLEWADVHDGRGYLSQAKTGWPKSFLLSGKTIEALEACRRPGQVAILGGILSRRHIFVGMKKLADSVGLKGGTKRIRKGGASAVERDQPGAAMRYLGHRTHGLAERHYCDPRITTRQTPRPPELMG